MSVAMVSEHASTGGVVGGVDAGVDAGGRNVRVSSLAAASVAATP
jgi:hypothetical protein